MGEHPDPEAKTKDSKGFDFDEASAGFRAAWEDPAEPAAEVAAPTQVGLGPVAPPPAAAEEVASPAPVPAVPAVVMAPVQSVDPPPSVEAAFPIEAAPPAAPPAGAAI